MASHSILRAQVQKRSSTPFLCPHHHGNRVVYVCIKPGCNNSFACAKCVTSNHQGHKLEELTEFAASKKNSLKDKIKQGRENVLGSLLQKIKTTEQKLTENKTKTTGDVDKIVQRCDEIKAQFDYLCKKYTELRKKAGKENDKKLSEYKECLETLYTSYKAELEGCEATIEEGTDSEVIVAEKDFPQSPMHPDFPEMEVLQFQFTLLSEDQLENWFRQHLSIKVDVVTTTAGQGATGLAPKNSQKMAGFVVKRNISEDCSYIYALSDQLYVWFNESPTISLINKDGRITKTLTLQPGFENYGNICNVCISPTDNTLWSINLSSAITMQITPDGTELQTLEPMHAMSICVARSQSVIIGKMDTGLKIFTASGKLSTEISVKDTHITKWATEIVQCRKTGCFAITDETVVSVLDEKYRHLYTLHGETVTSRYRSIKTGYKTEKKFFPRKVCFDKDGDLLVIDRNNSSILLFSSRGQYIRTIIQETHKDRYPCAIAPEPDGTLWVARGDDVFMKIKYK